MVVEVDQGSKLYIFIEELLRWRELLDNRFRQEKLNKSRLEILTYQ